MKLSRWDTERNHEGIWLCDTPKEAQECNQFKCKFNKEHLHNAFKTEVLENKEKMATDYKDLAVLSWILESAEVPWWKRTRGWLSLFKAGKTGGLVPQLPTQPEQPVNDPK